MGMMLNLTFLFIFVKSFYRIYHIFKMEHSNNPTLQHNIPNIQEDSLELMLISNLDSTIPEEEYINLDRIFDTLDAASRLTNASMFVVDFFKNQLIYRSRSLIYTDQAKPKDIKRKSVNPYWSLMADEDFAILLETRKAYLDFFNEFTISQKLHHNYIIDYSISLNGKKHMVAQKFTPIKLSSNGNLWLGLFIITASTHKSCKHIAIYGEDFRYLYDFDKKKYLPFEEEMGLTEIERTILDCAAKGMTTEQIASQLFRSVNTIKTHRTRLFKKLHVSSINEALVFVSNYNL